MKINIKNGVCDNCHRLNDEVLTIKKYWWMPKVKLCQSCISRLFRSFRKGK